MRMAEAYQQEGSRYSLQQRHVDVSVSDTLFSCNFIMKSPSVTHPSFYKLHDIVCIELTPRIMVMVLAMYESDQQHCR